MINDTCKTSNKLEDTSFVVKIFHLYILADHLYSISKPQSYEAHYTKKVGHTQTPLAADQGAKE